MNLSPRKHRPGAGIHLVFGASGYIGTNLVPRLRAEGVPVRASSRRPEVLEGRGWEGVSMCAADALDPASLDAALDGVSVAYYLVHSMSAGKNFGELDLRAAENFARAAAGTGVQRIVYLGGLVPDNPDSEHIASRRDTGNVLRQGTVPVTEIRAGIIVGPGSAAFEVMRDLVYHLPLMITPRWVRAKSPPIALDNLLTYLVRVPQLDATAGRIYDAAGPEVLTYQEMMNILAEQAGRRKPWVIPVPVLSPTLSSYWLRFVTAVPTNVATALIQGLKHDFSADTAALQELVPQPLMGFRESVDAAFLAERQSRVAARWVEGAFALRQRRIDYAFYAKRASGYCDSSASDEQLWQVITSLGGQNRYFYLNFLWTIRETMDWLVGGRGLKRGRRDPQHLRVGDKVDSWTVIGIEPQRRLTMGFGMRAPGAGVLEFEITPLEDHRHRVTATAYWHPAGVFGLLYWLVLVPAHQVIFTGMTREICRRAEALATPSRRPSGEDPTRGEAS